MKREPNRMILYAYVVLTCVSVPVVCGTIIFQALTEDPENIFRYMRILNTGMDENIEMPKLGILIYFLSLAFVMMFFFAALFQEQVGEVYRHIHECAFSRSHYGKNYFP